MPYFKTPDEKLHFLDSADFSYILPAGAIPITDGEAAILQTQAEQPTAIPTITRRQMFLIMGMSGMITMAEAESAALGVIPASLLATFEAILTPAELSAAKITWATMTTISRNEALVSVAQSAFNKTSEELDQMFITAATL